MPMPPTLPQKWGIPGCENVRLGRFGSQRLNHTGIHLRCHSILCELNSAVPSGLGTHSLHRLGDPILVLSIPLGGFACIVRGQLCKAFIILPDQRCMTGKGSNGVSDHEVIPHDHIRICNVGHIEVPG